MPENETALLRLNDRIIYLRVVVTSGAKCRFGYSADGKQFTDAGQEFQAEVGRWIGAKIGIFCTRETQINDSGYARL